MRKGGTVHSYPRHGNGERSWPRVVWRDEPRSATKSLVDKPACVAIYQRDSFLKFGGVSEAAKLFQDHSSRAVFRKFLDHTARNRGTYDEGCVLHADKRTYLDLVATQKLMGDDENAAVALLDKLTAAKVTYRGFVFGCEVCKHAEWYSLAELTHFPHKFGKFGDFTTAGIAAIAVSPLKSAKARVVTNRIRPID